jgi:xanthine dehydrogenase accessory factor
MQNSFDEKILEEANSWIESGQSAVLATVIQTWGSSPRPVGSRMVVNQHGDFSGSVSGGCVESAVVRECIELLQNNNSHKTLEFKVSNESAWEVGLACGGEIAIYLENKLMQKNILQEALRLKKEKKEFSIITNLENSKNYIYQPETILPQEMNIFSNAISSAFQKRTNGILKDTKIFIENYHRPIQVIIVGAVHIAQYVCEFAKHLNFEIIIIDPRGYFASDKRFPNTQVINKWPNEAFEEIHLTKRSALIALTHDPKIDDPAIQQALKENCFYIGALGSSKTHQNRCERLESAGFSQKQIQSIFGPIGIRLGGRSASEIALSIVSQLVSEVYKQK